MHYILVNLRFTYLLNPDFGIPMMPYEWNQHLPFLECKSYIMRAQSVYLQKLSKIKDKDLDIYIPLLTGKPEQQQFAMQSGILSWPALAVGNAV